MGTLDYLHCVYILYELLHCIHHRLKWVIIRDVPQQQQVLIATAVLTKWEWPLHPFPLQLPLETVVATVDD